MLWGSRFKDTLDEQTLKFTSSISYDINIIEQDIAVSKAHANMLSKVDIISDEDNHKIQAGLNQILENFKSGNWEPDNSTFEDIHSAIEFELTNLIGDVGKKLHAARSRNDQVITDVRLWIIKSSEIIKNSIITFQKTLVKIASKNINTLMPGYTHLQRAQPISFAFHFLAYVEMFERDKKRFEFTKNQADESILGCGALAGTTLNIDREITSKQLGFSSLSSNALDGVSNRDFLLDFLNACNIISMHLSRFCEELIIWTSTEWNFVQLSDKFTTGSSLMPQKKNPDIAEIVRGKSGRVFGNYLGLITMMKSLPLSYNRDMQEDKEGVFDSFNTVINSLNILNAATSSIKVNKDRFIEEIDGSFMLATDLADYLVAKKVPFRKAHEIIGNIVKLAQDKNVKLNQLTITDYKSFSNLFDDDIFNYLKAEKCLSNKKSYGSPNPNLVATQIEKWVEVLKL